MTFPDSIPAGRWSSKKSLAVFALCIGLLLLYSYFALTFPDYNISPGADYKRAYTWMVVEPERLPANADKPWTLNPLWQNFFMAPFVTTPWPWGYVLFTAFTLGVTALGAFWFGGNPILLLLSGQLSWVLWWGQLEGWAILALVVGWVGMERQAWWWMLLALAMASFKPHIGLLPVLAMWWWSGNARWKSVLLLGGVFIFTLVAWGPWPLWYLQGFLRSSFVTNNAPNAQSSLGIFAFPLVILALIVPLNRYQRILAIAAAGQLMSPYLPFYSMVLLLIFNVPWWVYALSFMTYFPSQLGASIAWSSTFIIPLSILAWLFLPSIKNWWQSRQIKTTANYTG